MILHISYDARLLVCLDAPLPYFIRVLLVLDAATRSILRMYDHILIFFFGPALIPYFSHRVCVTSPLDMYL